MVGKYPVITLCGSTRFKDAFLEAQKRLTLEGNTVISVGLFGHSGDDESGLRAQKRCSMTCTSEKSTWQIQSMLLTSVAILVPVPEAK